MITQAAAKVILKDGNVHTIPLHRHGDMGKILKEFGYEPTGFEVISQGFLDSDGNFYTRREAADYVRKHWNEHPTRNYCIGEELYSEDLY